MEERKLKIPMSLERVTSSGKFLTDNIFMKIVGCVVLSLVVSLVITMQLQLILPKTITWVLFFIEVVLLTILLIPKLALGEKKLAPVLENLANNKICNTNKFYDIYEFIGKVAMHNSGHISMFIEVTRGSTLNMNAKDKANYYNCLKRFEDGVLGHKYTLKTVNLETMEMSEERSIMLRQVATAGKYNSNLQRNLKYRYDYLEEFMKECMSKERFVYVVVSRDADTEIFERRITQLAKGIKNKHIKDIKIYESLTETENLAIEYFNTRAFDSELTNLEQNMKSILVFKGDVL